MNCRNLSDTRNYQSSTEYCSFSILSSTYRIKQPNKKLEKGRGSITHYMAIAVSTQRMRKYLKKCNPVTLISLLQQKLEMHAYKPLKLYDT